MASGKTETLSRTTFQGMEIDTVLRLAKETRVTGVVRIDLNQGGVRMIVLEQKEEK